EVEVLIFHLRRPIRREHVFKAATDGVTGVVAINEERRIKYRDHGQTAVITKRGTTLGINKSRSPSVAETTGHRCKPFGAIPESAECIREGAITIRDTAELALDTDHPIRPELIVGTDLTTAHERSITVAACQIKNICLETVVASKCSTNVGADI